jgi:hypothetical protein
MIAPQPSLRREPGRRVLFPLTAALCAAALPGYRAIAHGWSAPDGAGYSALIDSRVAHSGRSSLHLKSVSLDAREYAVRQLVRADAYRGKRVLLSGWIKPNTRPFGAALWLRVDMRNGDYVLDSMLGVSPEAIAASKDGWVRCELVADVPADALGFAFGVRMKGSGEVWADDLRIVDVDTSVPTTTIERRPYRAPDKDAAVERMRKQYAAAPLHPVNMSFEER